MNRKASSSLSSLVVVSFAVLVACEKGPTEPAQGDQPASAAAPKAGSAAASTATVSGAAANAAAPAPAGGAHGADPLGGKFSLADATQGLAGSGPLMATMDTSMGKISCKLYDDKAPNTVANFVGLARGTRPWKSPQGDWVKRPAYDGTTFHRVIKGFMIQGGDPIGNGTGEPGYTIKDEIWPGATHNKAGLLCMANRGHDTNGQQFFIIDTPDPQKGPPTFLDGNYTIFGECSPEATIHGIATVPVTGDHPQNPPAIKSVTISRAAK